ncbi:MAG TPA: M1 family peptidase [Chloroflexi bacterium]|nr:M1 family peptidase [Chloroflexota bacterium]
MRKPFSLLLTLSLTGCVALAAPQTGSPPLTTPDREAPTGTPLLAFTATPAPLATPSPEPHEPGDVASLIPNVTLDVELFYRERWMRVRQTVELTNATPDVWDEVVFNVPVNATPEAFYLDALTVTLDDTVQEGTPGFFAGETILRVPLPRPLHPDETLSIEMRYRVVIPPVGPTDWPPTGTTGWTFDLIQAGEWYPALVPYIQGEGWHTWRYHPVGDPTFYPLSNTRLTVRTEEGITVASGGPVGREGNVWRFEVRGARGVAFLASDRYEVVEREINGIPVRSYYLPETPEAGQAALNIAADAVALFSELYGPYPYESLTVAENGFFGGMEYSALISISDYVYNTYTGEPNSFLAALVAHETAHQWWYGAVGNDQANEPWLDESLAFYSELLYFERYYPEYTDWWWEARVTRFNLSGPVDATIYSYENSSDFILSMYGQAALFIHDLRGMMGDEAFFAFLQDYYRTYAGQIVTARDFFEAARRHAAVDLTPLFEAYFANPEP